MQIFDFTTGKKISSKLAYQNKEKFDQQLKQQKLDQQFNASLVFLWLNSLTDTDLIELERTIEVTGIKNTKNYIRFINDKFLEKLSNFIFTGNANNSGFSFMNKQQFDTLVTYADSGIKTNVSKRETIKIHNQTMEDLVLMSKKYPKLKRECDADLHEHANECRFRTYSKPKAYYRANTYDPLGEVSYTPRAIMNILKGFNQSNAHVNSYRISDITLDLNWAIRKTKLSAKECDLLRLWVNGEQPDKESSDYKHFTSLIFRICEKLSKTLEN